MSRHAIAEWAFNIIVLVFATSTVAQPFVIPSGSMEPTLMTGDHIIVDKLAFAPADSFSRHLLPYETPRHGDIVIFPSPVEKGVTLVKRLVGLPGDRLHMDHGTLWRNGVKLDEKYVQHIFPPDGYRDNFPSGVPPIEELTPSGAEMLDCCVRDGEIVVPPGKYFAMGDNRDNSFDSRFWGFVPAESVIGKPVLVCWSYAAGGDELTDFLNIHHLLDLTTHFFTKTRWDHTMRLVRGPSGS